MNNKPSAKSLQIAAQCWCDEETSHIEMDVLLATAFAKRLDFKEKKIEYLNKELEEAWHGIIVETITNKQYKDALQSIAINSCCQPCREAGLVAQNALKASK